jgi:hypothetical protein
MNAAVGVLGLLLIAAVIALPVLLITSASAPVNRARVERFARRQQLLITPDNGNQVIAYLATTRRWRVAGLLVALAAGITWGAYQLTQGSGEGSITVLQLLAGWFIGALIAEARLAHRPRGERRAAALRPREPSAYLSRFARAALPAALAISLAVAAVTVLTHTSGRDVNVRPALLATAAAVVIMAAVWTVRRRVLDRPQPVLPPDQLAADDAIRSRSLHVLAGAGATLVLYAINYQLLALRDAFPAAEAEFLAVEPLITLGAPVLGWIVATRPWSVTSHRPPAPPATAAPTRTDGGG